MLEKVESDRWNDAQENTDGCECHLWQPHRPRNLEAPLRREFVSSCVDQSACSREKADAEKFDESRERQCTRQDCDDCADNKVMGETAPLDRRHPNRPLTDEQPFNKGTPEIENEAIKAVMAVKGMNFINPPI